MKIWYYALTLCNSTWTCMCTLDSAQLHHTCILGVSVDMITVYEYIQCQSCISHKEKCPTIIIMKKFEKKWKSMSVSATQMNTCMVTGLTHGTLSHFLLCLHLNYCWRHDTNILYLLYIFPIHSTYSLQVATGLKSGDYILSPNQ